VLLDTPANLIHIIVNGGFPPTTPGDPRPYGMPPFGPSLDDAEIAVLASYLRSAWGNAAPAVSALDVLEAR
jgi:mono/diheme cytochrome c family protein